MYISLKKFGAYLQMHIHIYVYEMTPINKKYVYIYILYIYFLEAPRTCVVLYVWISVHSSILFGKYIHPQTYTKPRPSVPWKRCQERVGTLRGQPLKQASLHNDT